MRSRALVAVAATAVLGVTSLVAGPVPSAAAATRTSPRERYVVLYQPGVTDVVARAAVAGAGGEVLRSNAAVGYAVVDSTVADFALRAADSPMLVGAARDRSIGSVPSSRPAGVDVERRARTDDDVAPALASAALASAAADSAAADSAAADSAAADSAAADRAAADRAAAGSASARGTEPLSGRQWDMRQIGATPRGSYATQRGSRRVLVGVIDTGIDGTHPDIAPRFDKALSRNFTTDMRDIDNGVDNDGDGRGDEPCEVEPRCVDPVDEDDNGHGTHAASTIGSPINGVGIAGVAPDVTLVSLRAGQDSGQFFLQPTLDALSYAADVGIDVVNMSFYVDPWLFNCTNNPKDSRKEQAEQRTIRQAVQRAVAHARSKGVLPIAASGNESLDLDHPTEDFQSPDYGGLVRSRKIDNACLTVPAETPGVVTVTATGPGAGLAYYSNYGLDQADLAAPGGDYSDPAGVGGGAPAEVLAAYPERLARKNGDIGRNGLPTSNAVVRDCTSGRCSYYQYLQGTSMAAPHAAGVAALLVSTYGRNDPVPGHHGGLTLAPDRTEALLLAATLNHACPARSEGWRVCRGTTARNGFYGEGIVSASRAVR